MSVERASSLQARPLTRGLPRATAFQLSTSSAWAAAAVVAAALAYYHWRYEGWFETMIFAGSITAALVFLLALITRRALFSVTMIAILVGTIVAASDVKRHYVEMVLHSYDVVFYLTSWSTLVFLWADHKQALLSLVGVTITATGIGLILWRADSTNVPRRASAGLLAVAVALASWAGYAKGERRNTLFFWDNLYLSSFYASWSETLETLWKGQLLNALPKQPDPPFAIPASCALAEKPPHIILIHQESVFPPSQFRQIDYDRGLDPFFKSFDGQLHKLRVETYGGASWLTEFSVLAGISTYSFGGMRTFVQSLMRGKIHDAVPQTLARCGYHNAVFYPVPKDFVSNGLFYAAIGMPKIFDYKAQGAKRFNERDQFYYGNAIKYFEREITSSSAPLFTFIITSATHLPYTKTYQPEMKVPGGGPGTDPELNEYLRRLWLAKIDYEEFRAALARKFPHERFLIVQYGDHQPIATRTLLGFDKDTAAEDVKLTPESPGLLTYYSIDGVNYSPPPMPDVDVLEVPYIGTALLAAARIPLPQSYVERRRLLAECHGRYFTCPQKRDILAFHRRLMDSHLIDAR